MPASTFRIDPHPETGMLPSTLTEASAFTSEDHTELNCESYVSDDESILAGVWECAPCREEIKSYPVNELMTVVSGSLTLTHPDGRSETFTAGDSFFIAKGSKLIWEITETLRKIYMIAE